VIKLSLALQLSSFKTPPAFVLPSHPLRDLVLSDPVPGFRFSFCCPLPSMPALTALLTAVLAAGALAGTIPPRIGTTDKGTASLTQVRNPHFVRHGPLALAKAYQKYGAPLPEDLRVAVANIVQKRTTGSAVATPQQYDVEYLTSVSIGTPAQTLNLDVDTGSSDLWVFSSETPKSEVSGQTVYTPNKSSTAEKLAGATWQITYGDGSSSSGDVYMDKVTVGGLTVSAQAVEAAKQVSDEFTSDSQNDGLLGLAFSTINTVQPTRQKTFFDNAKSALNSPIFTADLKAGKRKCLLIIHDQAHGRNPRLTSERSGPLQFRLHRHRRLHRQHHLHAGGQQPGLLDVYI
jgi:hypothetical protein